MQKIPRGSLALFIGVTAGLLMALASSFFVSVASSVAPTSVSNGAREIPKIESVLTAPYRALVPPFATSTTVRNGETYVLSNTNDGCALFDAAATSTAVGTMKSKWCVLAGASIEGRFVHVLSGRTSVCVASSDSCELPPVSAWNIYDLRTSMLRPVPAPVRGGTWEAVDPIRSVGLFRGSVRSTIRPGEEDFWALTDDAGAAFWTGRIDDIDPLAQLVAGERLVSRPDAKLVFSYLAINEDGNEELRLATFNGKIWRRVALPASLSNRTWRLTTWAVEKGEWTATLDWNDTSGTHHEKVQTQ